MKKLFLLIYCLTALGLAQIRISDLPELKAIPDSADLFVIVDRSTDTTKAISKGMLIKQLLDSIQTLRGLNNALFDSIAVLRNLIGLEVHPVHGIFVDSENGNDDSSGYTETAAIQTLAKLESLDFDTILTRNIYLKKNSNFNEAFQVPHDSLTFSSYGIGAMPIIQTYDSIPGWWIANNWTDDGGNEWTLPLTNIIASNSRLCRLWINDTEVKRADFSWSAYAISQWFGPDFPFYHDSDVLHIYSVTNPATTFYSMRMHAKQGTEYTFKIIDFDNVTVSNLDIRSGAMASIGFAGADYLTIKNCNIGNYSVGGIMCSGNFDNNNDESSNYFRINNNTIDSKWDFIYLADGQSGSSYGIYIGSGGNRPTNNSSYGIVDSCIIKNYWFGAYFHQRADNNPSAYNTVSNCDISNNNYWTGGKGIQSYSWSLSQNDTTGMNQYNSFYNNYIHNLGGSGICLGSNKNYVSFNIIDSMFLGTNAHIYPSNGGIGIECGTEDFDMIRYNYIFNNTIYKTWFPSIQVHENYVYNNILLEPYQMVTLVSDSTFFTIGFHRIENIDIPSIKNNLVNRNGKFNSGYLAELNNYTYKTLSQLNAATNSSGNIYPDGFTTYQIINHDFSLPSSSPGKNSGIDISSLVPVGFRDRLGNLVNRISPNMGAIDN